jgi:iron complex outermembrane receptor protein
MNASACLRAVSVLALVAAWQTSAFAQRAGENAVTDADDAFGTSVGLESTGIYSDRNTRGFSPLDAGNARIDGVYYDPVGSLSGRLRKSTTIRVGFAGEGFPFHAPTGIVDYKFKPFPDEYGASIGYYRGGFDGRISELDLRLPVIKDHLGLTGGIAEADLRNTDGSRNVSWGWTIRPIIRFKGVEIAPFFANADFRNDHGHPLVVVRGPDLPDLPTKRVYLGQDWARRRHSNNHYGGTVKARLGEGWSFRGGLFHAVGNRFEDFTEIYAITGPDNAARHLLFADPYRDIHSTSGEALIGYRLGGEGHDHRFFAGYRARDRYTETDGSDFRDFGPVEFGRLDPQPEPDFAFGEVNQSRLRQSSIMSGRWTGSATSTSACRRRDTGHALATARPG